MELVGLYKDKRNVDNVILDLAQKNRQVIYGQQAINIQLPSNFRRKTSDFDILTKKPKQSAEKLASALNKEYGEGSFNVVPAKYGKTFKVKDKKGKTVADYTLTTKKPKSKEIWGVRYANLDYQEKKLKKILKDENNSFRFEKDMETLNKIRRGRL